MGASVGIDVGVGVDVGLGAVVGDGVMVSVGRTEALGDGIDAGVVAVSPTWQATRNASIHPSKQILLECMASSLIR
jgi:hypothetical protein